MMCLYRDVGSMESFSVLNEMAFPYFGPVSGGRGLQRTFGTYNAFHFLLGPDLACHTICNTESSAVNQSVSDTCLRGECHLFMTLFVTPKKCHHAFYDVEYFLFYKCSKRGFVLCVVFVGALTCPHHRVTALVSFSWSCGV